MGEYKKRGVSDFSKFSKQKKIILIFFLFMIAASVIFAITSLIANQNWTMWAFVPLFYFFALFIVTSNLHNLKKILKKLYKPLTVLFYSGMILYFAAFTVFCFLIFGFETTSIPENPDVIIILGCQVYGERPSRMLKSRLETTIEVLEKYPDTVCVVSGGQGPDETVPESETMKLYLVSHGINGDRIYKESESHSSFTNLKFSKNIIEQNNLEHKCIIIVTSEYHLPRTVLIAQRVYPDANIYGVKSNSPHDLFGAGILREFFAFMKSFIVDKA